MDLSKLNTHYQLLEKIGFISNCPPNVNLQINHDDCRKYCKELNKFAIANGRYTEEPYNCVHLNEMSGDLIAIYSKAGKYKSQAMDVLNTEGERASKAYGYPRNFTS